MMSLSFQDSICFKNKQKKYLQMSDLEINLAGSEYYFSRVFKNFLKKNLLTINIL